MSEDVRAEGLSTGVKNWPGASGAHGFRSDADGAVTLFISLDFDPTRIERLLGEDFSAALARWRALTEPRLATSLGAEPMAVPGLGDWIAAVAAWLDPAEKGPLPLPFNAEAVLARPAPEAMKADIVKVTAELIAGAARLPLPAQTPAEDARALSAWESGGALRFAYGEDGAWAIRFGEGTGIGIAPVEGGAATLLAPVPLTTRPWSGTARIRRYAEAWTGDGSDAMQPDRELSWHGFDLEPWAADFAARFGRLAQVYPPIAAHRQRLGAGIGATMAPVPVLAMPGAAAPAIAEMQAAFAEAAAADPGAAFASAAVLSVPTEVSRVGPAEEGAFLHGPLAAPAAAPGQMRGVPRAVATLTAGAGQVVALLPAGAAAGGKDFSLTGEAISIGGEMLRFIVPVEHVVGVGGHVVHVPSRTLPAPPALLSSEAIGPEAPASLADALRWSCRFTVARGAATERLVLSVRFNERPDSRREAAAEQENEAEAKAAAAGPDPQRAAPADLFEALAQFALEAGSVEPHLGSTDKDVAARALERMEALVAGVASTWSGWRQVTAAHPAPGDAPPPGAWLYAVDFHQAPSLVVTRSVQGTETLPPWPAIEGYAALEEAGATGLYSPAGTDGDGPLTLTIAGLPVTAVSSASVAATIIGNFNLVPPDAAEGAAVDEAFLQRSATKFAAPVVPLNEVDRSIGLAGETLSAALAALMETLAAAPDRPVPNPAAAAASITISYVVSVSAGEFPVETKMPILHMPTLDPAEPQLPARLAGAILQWREQMQPAKEGASLRISVSLSTADGAVPLAKISGVRVGADGEKWWI